LRADAFDFGTSGKPWLAMVGELEAKRSNDDLTHELQGMSSKTIRFISSRASKDDVITDVRVLREE